MAGGGKKAVVAAMAANGGIAVAKFVAFGVTGSSSMLAEGIHSVADTANQGLLLWGGAQAEKEATPLHSFGYGRERYFWAFVVAIVLFALGSLFALFEGYEKIVHADDHGLESAGWAIGVLLIGLVLEGLSYRTAIHEANKVRRGAGWLRFVRQAREPELPVVLLEDTGALVGLVLALIGVGMTIVTGNAVWDGIGTVAIGLLLGVIAITLAREMKSLLIGESATPEEEGRIAAAVEAVPAVRSLIHLRTQHLAPDELLVAVKAEYDGGLTMSELARAIDETEACIRDAVPTAEYLFVEPDVRRAAAAGGDA